MRILLTLALVCTLSFAFGDSGQASSGATSAVVHVAPTGSDSAGCGSTSQPCKTIQYAIDNSSGATTIKLAEGTYTSGSSAVVRVLATYQNPKDIVIEGGYTPTNWTSPTQSPAITRIDGQNQRRGFYIEASGDTAINLTLRNLTIQNGLANQPDPGAGNWYQGGGLLCVENQTWGKIFVLIENLVIANNVVQGQGGSEKIAKGGGANFEYGCRAKIVDTLFDNNRVDGGDAVDASRGGQALGGGLYAGNGTTIEMERVTFRNNVAQAGNGGSGQGVGFSDALGGGAAFQLNSLVTSTDITVIDNSANAGAGTGKGGNANGGGLFFEKVKEARFIGGLLQGNVARSGEVTARAGAVTPTDSGVAGGGAINIDNTVITLERLRIFNNQSLGGQATNLSLAAGGAMQIIVNSTVTASNLVIANNGALAGKAANQAGGGGAIFLQNSTMVGNHLTLANNSVSDGMISPAIDVQHTDGNTSRLTLNNSIVSNHTHRWANIISAHRAGDTAELSYVLFAQNTTGGSDIGNFGAGGPPSISNNNPVTPGDPAYANPAAPVYDYRLTYRSAAINKAGGSGASVDFENQARPWGGAPDVGADEYANPIVVGVSPAGEGALLVQWWPTLDLLPGAGGFNVVSYSNGQSYNVSLAGRTYLWRGLTQGQNYEFGVEVLDAAGAPIVTSARVSAAPFDNLTYVPHIIRP